jgi:hypothetical protein
MTEEQRDPFLQSLFAHVEAEVPAQPFTQQVMSHSKKIKQRLMLRRAVLASLLALVAIALDDFAIAFAQVLIVSLIDIESTLVAQLLAPINSVGGLLSMVLLGIRLFYKRLFQ